MQYGEMDCQASGDSFGRQALAAPFILSLALALPGLSEERRTNLSEGHAMVDDDSGRVEFYGSDGRLTS